MNRPLLVLQKARESWRELCYIFHEGDAGPFFAANSLGQSNFSRELDGVPVKTVLGKTVIKLLKDVNAGLIEGNFDQSLEYRLLSIVTALCCCSVPLPPNQFAPTVASVAFCSLSKDGLETGDVFLEEAIVHGISGGGLVIHGSINNCQAVSALLYDQTQIKVVNDRAYISAVAYNFTSVGGSLAQSGMSAICGGGDRVYSDFNPTGLRWRRIWCWLPVKLDPPVIYNYNQLSFIKGDMIAFKGSGGLPPLRTFSGCPVRSQRQLMRIFGSVLASRVPF